MSFLQVLWTYGVIIFEFTVEFYVFLFLFLRKLEKRSRFTLRAVLLSLAYAAIGLPVAWFYTAFGDNVWGRIAVYLVLFGTATGFAYLCFAESYITVLFCCSMAYASQNLVYKLFLIFWTFGESIDLFSGWGERFDLYYRLVYYSFYAACYAAVWFLFIRGITSRLQARAIDRKMLAVTVFVLAITVVLCSFEDVYFAQLSVWRENRFDEPIYYILRQTGNIFSVVCCVIALVLASKTIVEQTLQREVEFLKHAVRQGERQYEISKDTIDLINVKCHDIKYKLNALAMRDGVSRAAMDDLSESISIYDTRISTGNKLLDVLLTEKSLYCEQNKITLSCMADGKQLEFIEPGDLYCLFGNLLDNALEAVKAIAQDERRVINLAVKAKDGMVFVQEENYFDGKIVFENGLPLTTKEDKSYHGFGMHSLRMIVTKYGGELTSYVIDDIFHLNIIFPIHSISRQAG